jgi:hypothetical protein
VSIGAPRQGASVSGEVTIEATATSPIGMERVEFLIDGALKGSKRAAPYSHRWLTTLYSEGAHSVTVAAYDALGGVTMSEIMVSVTQPTSGGQAGASGTAGAPGGDHGGDAGSGGGASPTKPKSDPIPALTACAVSAGGGRGGIGLSSVALLGMLLLVVRNGRSRSCRR